MWKWVLVRALPVAGLLDLGGLAACAAPPSSPQRLVRGDYALEFVPDERTLRLRRGGDTLLTFPPDAFQIGTVDALDDRRSYDPYWLSDGQEVLAPDPPASLRWQEATGAQVAAASDQALELALDFTAGLRARLYLEATAEGRFAARLVPEPSDLAIAWLRLRPRADASEGFYGLGEWPDDVNHRGKVRPVQIELDVTESSNNENHVPVPLLLGTRGWGLFVQSRRVGSFDVARAAPDLIEVTFGTAEQSADGLTFHLLAAARPLDLLRRYYDVTSDPLLPAPWALGPWIWRDESKSQAQILDDIVQIRALDLATSALWLDRPYASAVESFDFEPARIPDAPRVIAAAHKAGLRMAVWHAPYLEDKAPDHPLALAAGYFPPKTSLLLNGWSPPIDFTNPEAYAFWQQQMRFYTDHGIEGFKLDYGEDIAPSLGSGRNVWRFFDGSDERTMHYGYTTLYHRVYAELLAKSGGFLLCRAGRWGDQRYVSVIWPGDMDATFTRHRERFKDPAGKNIYGVGGLPATVIQGINLGVSGFPFFAADTGGYRHAPADRELYIRWFEQTALSTVMQVGDSSSQTPWEFTPDNGRDAAALDLYRRYARLHMRLFPYEWTYAQNIQRDGRPIQRPFGLVYPELGRHPSDQYLFGDDLLVAPVLERGAQRRQVELPPGDWIDYWDGTVYHGGAHGARVEVPAPLDKLPLLARAGAVVPLLRPTIDTLAPAADPGVESFADLAGPLFVRLFPGATDSAFALYDGTEIRHSAAPHRVSVRPGSAFIYGATLELLRAAVPQGVQLDGSALVQRKSQAELDAAPAGWFWDAAGAGTLWIKVPPGVAAYTVELVQ